MNVRAGPKAGWIRRRYLPLEYQALSAAGGRMNAELLGAVMWSRRKSSILLQEAKHTFQTSDKHPIICASDRCANTRLAPWHCGNPVCNRHQQPSLQQTPGLPHSQAPVLVVASVVQSTWIRAEAFLLCPWLTRPKPFTWTSHYPGDTITSHSTPRLDGWDDRTVTWAMRAGSCCERVTLLLWRLKHSANPQV